MSRAKLHLLCSFTAPYAATQKKPSVPAVFWERPWPNTGRLNGLQFYHVKFDTNFFKVLIIRRELMTYLLIFSWIALIYVSYKGAVVALDKAGLL
jgi:hypothetical protein